MARWVAAGLSGLFGLAGGGIPAADGGSVVRVDGMIVDLLDPAPEVGIDAPDLTVDMDARAGRLVRRPLDAPPPTLPEREQAGRHYNRAMEYIRKTDLTKAMLEIRDGLTYTPDDPRLLSLAAMISSQMRDLDASANYFHRYLEVDPANLQHTAAFVAVLIRLSRIDEADRVLTRGEAIAPDFMPFHFHRACLDLIAERFRPDPDYWRQRPFDEIVAAIQWLHADRTDLTKIVGADGYVRLCEDIAGAGTAQSIDRIRAALDAAATARTSSDWTGVAKALRETSALGIHGYGVRTALAEALENLGQRDTAIAEWQSILGDFRDLPQAWVSAGHVLLRSARFEAAMPIIRRAKELAPDEPVVDFLLASAQALTGKIADAQVLYADLVMRHPRELRKWLESDAVFEAALDKMPNRAAFLRRLDIPPEVE